MPLSSSVLLSLMACGGFAPVHHEDRASVWVEFVPATELPLRVAQAASLGVDANVAFERGLHTEDDLRATCQAAADADVALLLWPLLPEDEGYWANQENADAFADWTRALVGWARRHCRRVDGVVIDLEMPIDRMRQLEAVVADGGGAVQVAAVLLSSVDEAAFEHARDVFAELTVELHGEGLRVELTALPVLADDVLDGDEGIAQALGTPVNGIDADAISLQVYRSSFDALFAPALADPTMRFGPGLITSYAATATATWGDRAGLDLGLTGPVGFDDSGGLASAAELQVDVAAALAAGSPVGRIAIDSLEGLDGKEDVADWLAVPAPLEPPADPATDEIRGLFATLDALR